MPDRSEPSADERAEHLQERIYVTFTALAVVLALRSHGDELTAGTAAATLVITVVGILLAVLTVDFMSHLVVHARMPSRGEAAHMARVCVGAFGAVVLPLVFVVLAGTGVWRIEAALCRMTPRCICVHSTNGSLLTRRRVEYVESDVLLPVADA